MQSANGAIWDRLPAGFPIYPGLEPITTQDATPWSAKLGVSGVSAQTLATWYIAVFDEQGYTHQPLRGPLEDRSLWLTVSGNGGCTITIAFVPGDTMTQVLVGYGATCSLD